MFAKVNSLIQCNGTICKTSCAFGLNNFYVLILLILRVLCIKAFPNLVTKYFLTALKATLDFFLFRTNIMKKEQIIFFNLLISVQINLTRFIITLLIENLRMYN